ncbi:4Fe-4S dicluster domain-containing protein [Pseudoroseomonas wenyumeiae]|uniref:4Fe-4S dicluster domain-containing protein n=2 Tax=Teichococcus wenyumeiae TaxID=2478470 RepID=A0ABX9VJM4_9PROT|nr:4Fe-4S dicluster domain-containing protein [Pseudoroseomonas wenyumeiae]
MPPVSGPSLGRRQAALGLLASALTLTSCGEPAEEIIPYVEAPEGQVPGLPRRFATTLALNGYGRGVLATCFEGRPVKLEGNALHPASLGGTDAFTEAAILSLYDPDRSRTVRQEGRPASFEAFLSALKPRLAALEARGGAGLHLLTGHVTSPTLRRLIGRLRARFPAAQWHAEEPVDERNALAGAEAAFGQRLRARPRLESARVVLTLDADPLGPGPEQVAHARAFAARRQARRGREAPFLRLYAAEPLLTNTGAKADHRLALRPWEVRDLAIALAARLGAAVAEPDLPPAARRFLDALAADLQAHPGEAVALAGPWAPPELHALVHWINVRLGAPVDYLPAPEPALPLAPLAEALRDGSLDTLLILGANPAYDAPADLGFGEALGKSRALTIHLGPWRDETAMLCRWHLPERHPLEDWADHLAPDGTASIAQPLITPLHGGHSAATVLGLLGGRDGLDAHAALRETWMEAWGEAAFEPLWRQALHDGVVAGSAAVPVLPPAPALPDLPPAPLPPGLALLLRPDPMLWDGRFANNPWLQECPKPLTRQVWGNALLLAPAEARARALRDGDLVRLRLGGRELTAPVMLQPGMAEGVAALHLGGGRQRAGAIGDGIGANAYALRQDAARWMLPGLELEASGEQAELLRPQEAHKLEGESTRLLPTLSLEEFAARAAMPPAEQPQPASLFPAVGGQAGAAWAMVIDTTLCIGCNACVLACRAENNVPVVGPEEVAARRDMHWLRIDTYHLGESEQDPRPGFQPVPCMHCETAPCEPVCPVAASVHDAEGLNVQVYNRCIGTRFCQGNCPYKVRRFNFHGYADGQEYANQGDPLVAAQRNPEVTVRGRGVMEKCTYCTQRISAARRAAAREGREIADGEVQTACQSACPAQAISFGDLKKPGSAVSALRREPQHYALLEELNTRPRTTYLAQARNANPALEDEA